MSATAPPAGQGRVTRAVRGAIRAVDIACDALTLSALVSMGSVLGWQVFARFALNASPRWASEVALLLLAWVGLLGIAIGIREHAHIAVSVVVDRLPERLQRLADHLGSLLMLLFGVYLVVQGTEFTRLMHSSTLPGSGLPNSLLYAAMPTAGVLICVYSLARPFHLTAPRFATPDRTESAPG